MNSRLILRPQVLHGLSGILAAFAAAQAMLFFVVRASHGIWFRSWGDELEHMLGGWALTSGDRLYESFVDLHGPFIFFLAKSYGDLFGWSQGNYIRIIPIVFLLLATLAVGTSQSLCRLNQRSWAVTIFVGLSTTVWIVQGLYLFEYYLVSGALLTIVLACYAVPAWRGLPVSRAAALLSGASATLAVFTSHAWLPTAAALFMSNILQPDKGTNKRSSALAFAGATVLTTAACLAWLWNYGSTRGYIVFHVIFAHTVYLQTIRPVNPELTLAKFGVSLMPSFSPERLVQSLSNVLLILSVIMGLRLYRPVALAFGVLGILAANARGNVGFQDGTFLILSIALFALTAAQAVESMTKPRIVQSEQPNSTNDSSGSPGSNSGFVQRGRVRLHQKYREAQRKTSFPDLPSIRLLACWTAPNQRLLRIPPTRCAVCLSSPARGQA